jgi:hypothetical protein
MVSVKVYLRRNPGRNLVRVLSRLPQKGYDGDCVEDYDGDYDEGHAEDYDEDYGEDYQEDIGCG